SGQPTGSGRSPTVREGVIHLGALAYARASDTHNMINPFQTRLAAIFWNEVLLNTKRITPYVVAALCAGNAVLWWGWGPAVGRGVAHNSDLYIAGVLPPYSFLFLPLYTALMMADPSIRDFREGVDPLIFSKPVRRAEYLVGNFFGN